MNVGSSTFGTLDKTAEAVGKADQHSASAIRAAQDAKAAGPLDQASRQGVADYIRSDMDAIKTSLGSVD
jgi:hypothetical protein